MMASSIHSTNSSRSGALPLAALLLALAPLPASARDREEDVARAEFRKGKTAFDLGRFDEALRAYSNAYEHKPMPAFLFNIAQCHKELGNCERAIFFYKRYLDRAGAARDTETVKRLIDNCEAKQKSTQPDPRKDPDAREELARGKRREDADTSALTLAPEPAAPSPAVLTPNPLSTPDFTAPPLTPAPEPTVTASAPLYKQWWLWTAVGVVVAGSATTAAVLASRPQPTPTTLGTLDGR